MARRYVEIRRCRNISMQATLSFPSAHDLAELVPMSGVRETSDESDLCCILTRRRRCGTMGSDTKNSPDAERGTNCCGQLSSSKQPQVSAPHVSPPSPLSKLRTASMDPMHPAPDSLPCLHLGIKEHLLQCALMSYQCDTLCVSRPVSPTQVHRTCERYPSFESGTEDRVPGPDSSLTRRPKLRAGHCPKSVAW